MATVTGLTAARMLEIEAESIVSGVINAEGRLILTTHGGTDIDAGNVYSGDPAPESVAYQHIQSAPMAVWDIYHTLVFAPNIMVVDSTGIRVFGDEQIIGPGHIRIIFSGPFSGIAYLS